MEESELLELLLRLAKGDDAKRNAAAAAAAASLGHAIQEYRRRIPPSLSKSRKSLVKLSRHLEAARAEIKRMPFDALHQFVHGYEAPRGRLLNELDRAYGAAKASLDRLAGVPAKSPDEAGYFLAWRAARVFDQILEVVPTATRDDAVNINFSHGGAAYARVLRYALAQVGRPNVDIGPLVDEGLRLLDDDGMKAAP